ncbi:MAG: protoheme IX farnesyltransferase [Candidatus Kapabacteria bacterium]|nr:protoheme IX farnesyltransferase [Candidatus Kapabacteria bacterium]
MDGTRRVCYDGTCGHRRVASGVQYHHDVQPVSTVRHRSVRRSGGPCGGGAGDALIMAAQDADMALPIDAPAAQADVVRTSIVRDYYELTKPGITQMVAMTTLAGYYLALPVDLATYLASASSWLHFFMTMLGTISVSSGSCVVNHILERDDDGRMKRTMTRPIPAGRISTSAAWAFGVTLTVLGLAMLTVTNPLTLALAAITWLSYVAIYTPLKKRTTIALYLGGVPGALPFAGGWTALRGSMDAEAWALFAILFFWQIPHFLALSWMYRNDYASGGFVMHAVEDRQGRRVGLEMILTSGLTMVSALLPTLLGMTGMLSGIVAVAGGGWLVFESWRFLRDRQTASARRVLLTSYAVLMGIVVLMFLDKA